MSRFVPDPSLFDLDNDEHEDIFGGDFGGRGSPAHSSSSKSKSSSTDCENEERILSSDEFAALGPRGLHVTSDLPSPGSVKSGDGSQYSMSSDASSSSSKSKYLYPKIDTVEILHPEEVRWFYKEPLDKKWTAFIGYDSLRIECKYRELQHTTAKVKVMSDVDEEQPHEKDQDSTNSDKTNDEKELETDSERINVRGGLYEVDVMRKESYPIYWTPSEG